MFVLNLEFEEFVLIERVLNIVASDPKAPPQFASRVESVRLKVDTQNKALLDKRIKELKES